MTERQLVTTSKFLSKALRHDPAAFGLTMDPQGWVAVDQLIACARRHRHPLTRETLAILVERNDKKRFAFSPDGNSLRASQGHSIAIDLDLPPLVPPETLYHGTATRFMNSIRKKGLIRGSRQHVHLTDDPATARKVGQRHGVPVILAIRSGEMHRQGHRFMRSANGVWLVGEVPREFLSQA